MAFQPFKKIKEFFKPTPKVRFRDVLREIPVTLGVIGQDILRNIASAGVTISRIIAPKELKPYVEDVSANEFFEPIRGVAGAMFRDEPIKSIEQRIVEAEPKVKDWGKQLKEKYPNSGLGDVGSFMEKNPTALSFAAIMGSVGLDLTFFGGLEKNALKALVKTKTTGEAISILTKMGIADDLAKTFADDVVKIASEKQAKQLFLRVAEIQRTTKVAPGIKAIPTELKPLAEEARKYKSAEEFWRAQPKVFRGDIIEPFDITKISPIRGVSVTKSRGLARDFAEFKKTSGVEQEFISEFTISPNAKILTENKIPSKLKIEAREATERFIKTGQEDVVLEKIMREKQQVIIDYARKNGFDGVKIPGITKELTELETVILNPNVLKTKSQLTDFYNQAVKGVKEAIIPPAKPPIPPAKPPIPPTPPPAELPEFAGKVIDDPIIALNKLLKEAKPARKGLEKAYTAERARRIAQVDEFIAKNIDEVGGEEGYAKILSKLKGELAPEAKIKFEPIKQKLTPDQLKQLYIRTWKHPYLDNFEKINAAEGLTSLMMGGIPQPKQLVLLEEIYGTELIKNILSKRMLGAKATDFLIELGNIPRMFLVTAEMSGLLRQGIIAVSHPVTWTKSAAKTFHFAFSPKAFNQYFDDLYKDPLYPLMRKAGVGITDPRKIAGGLVAREEAFISRLLQKIPIVGIPFRFAERSYVGFLNKLRVDWFKNWADELLSKGYSPIKDLDTFKAAANVVNTFTGRGSLGQLNRVTPALNVLLFSPRLQAARFNALNPFWYGKMALDPATRPVAKKAISDFAKFVGVGLSTLAMIQAWKYANKISDEDLHIESNPRSSDFGKIKMGNTRFDIWGGFQQWARVFAQLVTGERKNTSTGEIVSLNKEEYPFTTRKEVLLRFIEGKLAPVPALVNELMSGAKTFTGEDITFKTVIKEKFIPIYIQDIADAYADGGLGRAVGAGGAAFFGVGVQTWEEPGRVLPPAGMEGLPLMPMPGLPTTQILPPMPGIFK